MSFSQNFCQQNHHSTKRETNFKIESLLNGETIFPDQLANKTIVEATEPNWPHNFHKNTNTKI